MGYLIEVTDSFSSAHQLRGYHGKCERLHGHNWKVTLVLSAKRLNKIGLVVDFGEAKRFLSDLLRELDHTLLNEHPYFVSVNPSSENIARYIFNTLTTRLKKLTTVRVERVEVWESERTKAVFYSSKR